MTITNVITAGDYKGYIDFKNAKKGLYIYGAFGLGKKTFINKDTVDHYEVIGEETNTSFGSSVTRGILGAAAFGAVGAIAGASSAKKKGITPSPSFSRTERSAYAISTTECSSI